MTKSDNRKMFRSGMKVYSRPFYSISRQYVDYLRKELQDCKTVLDLGYGRSSPLQYFSFTYSVGVELFKPYLQETRKARIFDDYIFADIREIEFKEDSFDAVLALDVLEHLTKEDGYRIIRKMQRWARMKVIIFTPNGFVLQNAYDNNPFQIHISGWTTSEFERMGFRVYGVNGWKMLRKEQAELKFKPRVFWQVISEATQKIVCFCPEYAFQLLCIKELVT